MGIRRYWIEPEKLGHDEISIDGDLLHHLKDVCRLEVGSQIELLCGDGRAYLVQLKMIGKKLALATKISVRSLAPLKQPWVHLALSIPKISTFESILERSVEMGVKSVTPFVSDFSFIRSKKEFQSQKSAEKMKRWRKIIESATQQSGRGDLMNLDELCEIKEVFKKFNQNGNAQGLFSYEGQGRLDVKSALRQMTANEDILVFVGSEGGFSDNEVQLFCSHGLEPVSLGEQVLRVETACMALLSVIKYECDLLK